ncbi:unnamed protein product [Chrysodeixis includens]|uniref:Uncharacterized protein n=1 Tax=Chrysodeixis includens TaxID=689277 RepID=A0A9P0BQ48_CHRIL|nr:unnamed protein product [Chrysodeixis includens]
MWTTVLTNPQFSLEPLELRMLKRQLACVTCRCDTCSYNFKPLYEKVAQLNNKRDREVQAEGGHSVAPKQRSLNKTFNHDGFCPTCCMTLQILRGGMVKVYKDVESETTKSMFCCDKATGKRTKYLEKTTSVTKKPCERISNLTLCDFISENSSIAVSSSATNTPPFSVRKRIHKEKVKFQDTTPHLNKTTNQQFTEFNCTCIESFIDSIRPPMDM